MTTLGAADLDRAAQDQRRLIGVLERKAAQRWGADLSDPKKLLEGSGKVHRHVRFKGLSDLKRPGLKPLLKTALAAWKRRKQVGGYQANAAGRRLRPR